MPCRRGVLVFALVLLALGPGEAQTLPPELQPAFERGVAALKAGRLDAAETAFRGVIAGGGGLAYVHNNLGIVHQERGQHANAVVEFRAAIRADAAYAAPRILLGASLLALGRLGEARAALKQAVRIAPGEPLARLQLARVHERAGEWTEAVEQYRVLRELEPANSEYVYGLATSYLRLSEWCLREIQALDSKSARLQQALGHTYRVQGRPDLALAAFARAAEADPTLPEIHLAMAQIHMEQRRWAEARREVERELQVVPESAGARALRARLSELGLP
jgi:Tfp pilus assembly protein PilF